jgi:hypothetical protein
MTREQVAERARRAIPDFLRRQKPAPPAVLPLNRSQERPGKINWKYLFELAEKHTTHDREA